MRRLDSLRPGRKERRTMDDPRSPSVSRRAFLRQSAMATAVYYVGSQLPAEAFEPPSNMPAPTPGADRPVSLGIIGTGNQGQADLSQMVKVAGVKVLGVCDI